MEENKKFNDKLKGLPLIVIGVMAFLLFQNFQMGIIILLVLAIHELSHAAAMIYFGHKIKKFYFVPFLGAAVEPETPANNRYEEFIISAAGPFGGILTALLGFGVYYLYHFEFLPISQDIAYSFWYYATYALVINVFNLFPMYPLDGGHMLFTVLINKDSKSWHFDLILFISFLSLIAMSGFILFQGNLYFIYFLIGLFVNGFRQISKAKEIFNDRDLVNRSAYDIYLEIDAEEAAKNPRRFNYSAIIIRTKTAIESSLSPHRWIVGSLSTLSILVLALLTFGPILYKQKQISNRENSRNAFILNNSYDEYLDYAGIEYGLKGQESSPTYKSLKFQWEYQCKKHSDFSCRYLGYLHKMKNEEELANSLFKYACASGKDFNSCLEVIESQKYPKPNESTFALMQMENSCDKRSPDACRSLITYYEDKNGSDYRIKVLKEKACELGEKSYCYQIGRVPASL
ncbi:MAG: hypothetical protein COW00_17935 [Bdellovibrio sp. CG12_big_fil_rev_8_21_14_0_65_39_13]|nr:MAG: hypothetical protein COW78_06235 [Bdellovibrio sp. CG22_combo_CG10-13_8_21_14_all_39_27]PIQ57989.1 MAG: hypothetical protein COW00_17935 [Bdellovibrio sp. CG12_big_fil_rev_8_21_14_0_65_39_13]PIR32876.1 MAG: hypothetical protein COV37_17405 [Bdellovibrio sp. CG11_big_fil_rev_8_21_14_0_20_39_38]